MKIAGKIEIYGMPLTATLIINEERPKGVTFVELTGKYKAYGYENGKIQFWGYYDSERAAAEAVKARRNLARDNKVKRFGKSSVGDIGVDKRTGMWRLRMVIDGARLSLGHYMTYGNAVLVRDVVARRTGKHVIVGDYSMPLSLVSDPVARSFITDRITHATQEEIAEFLRRVDELNGSQVHNVTLTHADKLALIEPEAWQKQQPTRVGHSPFDILDNS